jgi:hypothetical protein
MVLKQPTVCRYIGDMGDLSSRFFSPEYGQLLLAIAVGCKLPFSRLESSLAAGGRVIPRPHGNIRRRLIVLIPRPVEDRKNPKQSRRYDKTCNNAPNQMFTRGCLRMKRGRGGRFGRHYLF